MDLLQDRFTTSDSVLVNFAKGEDAYDPVKSEAVVFPNSNEELSEVLKLCNEHKTPVVPYGTGTSLEGHAVGNPNGITISLEKFDKILSVNAEDFDCRVQANVTREQLNEYLKDKGVFFPIDPGANAALGGMASCSASGTMAVKYGTMRTVVMGLTIILAAQIFFYIKWIRDGRNILLGTTYISLTLIVLSFWRRLMMNDNNRSKLTPFI